MADLYTKKRKSDQPTPQPISYVPKHDVESDSDSDSESSISELLEPLTRDQLISLLRSAASTSSSLRATIRNLADSDASHRKLFVHGLGFFSTADSLRAVFAQFGIIEDVRIVTDKTSGKSKGYGFILFRDRKSAKKALQQPQKVIDGRTTSCQLASLGPPQNASVNANPNYKPKAAENLERKIFVGNVHADIDPGRLKAFLSQFGEIEEGPLGLDRITGKPRGFVMFVYKTMDGFRKAIEEPNKNFEGHIIFVHKAYENNNGNNSTRPVMPGDGQIRSIQSNPNPNPNMNMMMNANNLNPNPMMMNPNLNANMNPNPNIAPPNPCMVPGNMWPGYQIPDMTALLTQGLLQQNPALLAMLAAAGQNPAALGFLNPAIVAALGGVGGTQAVVPNTGMQQSAMPGSSQGFTGMGNAGYQQDTNVGPPGYQGPPGFQTNAQAGAQQSGLMGGTAQNAALGQGQMQRPSVGQISGYGQH